MTRNARMTEGDEQRVHGAGLTENGGDPYGVKHLSAAIAHLLQSSGTIFTIFADRPPDEYGVMGYTYEPWETQEKWFSMAIDTAKRWASLRPSWGGFGPEGDWFIEVFTAEGLKTWPEVTKPSAAQPVAAPGRAVVLDGE